ncbi:MAG: hypothetical protein K2P51_05890 [Rhabdochlamydiaceae bacterium]|nr:hypothetical protein [Rhabdochlamydiaceae bacterium]
MHKCVEVHTIMESNGPKLFSFLASIFLAVNSVKLLPLKFLQKILGEVIMKLILSALFFTCALLHADQAESISEKTYISPNHVLFVDGHILVNLNNYWLQTTAVHVDDHGFYIHSFQFVEEAQLSWKCICGKKNEGYVYYCKKCGRPRS